jgi:hypothetical protein
VNKSNFKKELIKFESGSGLYLFCLHLLWAYPSGDFRVAEYRAFTIGSEGHFVGFEPIICNTDDQAIVRAKSLLDGCAIEVWCAERLIVKLKPAKLRPE